MKLDKQAFEKRLYAAGFFGRILMAGPPFKNGTTAVKAAKTLERDLDAKVHKEGKFSKLEGGYFPAPFPPGPWPYIYMCKTCAYYEPPATTENTATYPKCHVLGIDDGKGGDAIHPYHWCPLWAPREMSHSHGQTNG